jgi:hypothetical protein
MLNFTRTQHDATYSVWAVTTDAGQAVGYVSANQGRVNARLGVTFGGAAFTGTDVKAVARQLSAAYSAHLARRASDMPAGFTLPVRAA